MERGYEWNARPKGMKQGWDKFATTVGIIVAVLGMIILAHQYEMAKREIRKIDHQIMQKEIEIMEIMGRDSSYYGKVMLNVVVEMDTMWHVNRVER